MIDGDFDSHTFYFNIVDFFECAPGPAAKARVNELLLWWDRYVGGTLFKCGLCHGNRKVFGRNRDIVMPEERSASLTVSHMLAQHTTAEGN
jgi:hypothetical protein